MAARTRRTRRTTEDTAEPAQTPQAGDYAAGGASWLAIYSARRRQEDNGLRELLDQLTHGATDVGLHFDAHAWHARRTDVDGVQAERDGATLMDALNRVIPAYRRARCEADEHREGSH